MSADERPNLSAGAADAMLRDYERLQAEVNANVAHDGTGLQHDQVPYAQVPNLVAFSTFLSDGAKSTLLTLIALPRGWDVSAERLQRFKLERTDAIETSLRELRRFGFYRVERWQADRGRWVSRSLISRTPRRDWIEDADAYGDRAIPHTLRPDGTLSQLTPDDGKYRPWDGRKPDPATRSRGGLVSLPTTLSTGPRTTSATGAQAPGPGASTGHNRRSDRPWATEGRLTEGRLSDPRTSGPRTARTEERPTTKTTSSSYLGESPGVRDLDDSARGEHGSPRADARPDDLRDPRAPEVPHWRELDRVPGVPMPDGLRARRRSRPAATDRRPGYTLATAVAYDGRDDAHRAAVAASLPDPAPVDPATARDARRAALAASLPSDRPTDDPTAPEDPRATS